MHTNSFYDATLYIDLKAVQENYLKLQKLAHPAKCSAAIKANAYGLGVTEISNALYDVGCRDFFVATLGEAIFLRGLKQDTNIYVFHGIKPGEEEAFAQYSLTPVLNHFSQIEFWGEYAKKSKQKLPCTIHFDTGINRLGLDIDEAEFTAKAELTQYLDIKYIMSHLACANEIDNPRNGQQLENFNKLLEYFPKEKACIGNSAAIFLGKEYHFDMVRPGASLFGINPTPYYTENPMKNVVSLTSEIIHIRDVKRNGMVGYGNICPITKGMKLATIPVGYADGYLRSLTNRGYCFLKGKIIPTLGKISMDMTIIDISSFKDDEIKIGDKVEIIGENINLSDLSRQAGTIPYEILTSFSSRFKKVYLR